MGTFTGAGIIYYTGEVSKRKMSISMVVRGKGDMKKSTYDPDDDGILTVANTVADMEKSTYDTDEDGWIETPRVILSDDLLTYDDAEESTTSTTYVKKKEFILYEEGAFNEGNIPLRIKFDLMLYNYGADYYSYGRIYKNGSPVGTERSTQSATYVTYSEDIEGWKNEDHIEVYIKLNSSDTTGLIRNCRIYGKLDRRSPSLGIVEI
jgi:hypothetical protein